MSGLSGLIGRIKKCGKIFSLLNKTTVHSIVYMDRDGEIIWEEGVEYNPGGVLVVPLPMNCEEWEAANLIDEKHHP